MARIAQLVSFSDCFALDPTRLDQQGVLNPFLNADTPLFIDPLLLPYSVHREMNTSAKEAFEEYFGNVISLLKRSTSKGDIFWVNAERHLIFPEVKGVCLGFGGASVSGSGSGPHFRDQLMRAAKQIVDIGYEEPKLFPLLALLEDGIGPDRISDMTAGVIEEALCKFAQRVAGEFDISTEDHISRKGRKFSLPTNPYQQSHTPVLLVPLDVLRKMPIAKDWDGVMSAASENATIRHQVNTYIGEIFEARTKAEREAARRRVRAVALTNVDAFKTVVAMVDAVDKQPYDAKRDEDGVISIKHVKSLLPLDVKDLGDAKPSDPLTVEAARDVVASIIERFRFWIEDRRMATFLWNDDASKRHERFAQRLFFIVADEICRQNNLDISPETDSGGGPVDFKFSTGYDCRIIVEVKLSTNTKLLPGFTRQLEAYKTAEDAKGAFYVVIDVGNMGKKDEKLLAVKNSFDFGKKVSSEIEFIDGVVRPSASQL